MKIIFILVAIGIFADHSFAQKPAATPLHKNPNPPPECRAIVQACERANRLKKETGSVVDTCLTPILNGKTIKGVKVPPSVLKGCKDASDIQAEADKAHSDRVGHH